MIKELEQKIRELDSQIMAIHIYYDEQVKSLETELEKSENKIIELDQLMNNTMNQFYWFTANRRPIGVDVSYPNKENILYGFKQTPQYNVIEYNDLRFITHATLDELIEQFR